MRITQYSQRRRRCQDCAKNHCAKNQSKGMTAKSAGQIPADLHQSSRFLLCHQASVRSGVSPASVVNSRCSPQPLGEFSEGGASTTFPEDGGAHPKPARADCAGGIQPPLEVASLPPHRENPGARTGERTLPGRNQILRGYLPQVSSAR